MESLRNLKSASNVVKQKKPITSNNRDEDLCAICMGSYENMCHPNDCFHKFCFCCLEKWTKIKPACPYCQKKITSIIHSLGTDGTSEKYSLPHPSIFKPTKNVIDWPICLWSFILASTLVSLVIYFRFIVYLE